MERDTRIACPPLVETRILSLLVPPKLERWKGIEPSTFSLGRRHSAFELPSQNSEGGGRIHTLRLSSKRAPHFCSSAHCTNPAGYAGLLYRIFQLLSRKL